ncbi:MAG: hypothetical protein DSZ11_03780 [Sulfurovum sp.]|nr:MAG: hypothetical protein DSZ11_03780 [Sulfurovum sp.]
MKNFTLLSAILLYVGCASTTNSPMPTSNNRAIKLSTTSMQKEQRVALVIGNSNYQGVLSKLSNTINDAKSIRDILKDRGFEVIYKENTTKRSTKESLNNFYEKIQKGGVGMFYFSGHGIEVEGQNYLIPVDSDIKEKSDSEFEAISLNKITKRMQNAGNRLNIVVLDACRNDPFSKAIGVGGLAKVEPIGLFVSYSTGAGSVSSDGRAGGNGLFTKSLIKYMKQPLDLQDVFQKSREEVYKESNQKQFPAIYNQTINGKFFFTLPTKTTLKTTTKAESSNYQVPTHQTLKTSSSNVKLFIPNELKKKITVKNISSRLSNGFQESIIDIKNHQSQKQTVQYRYKWFDESGFEVAKNISTWQPIFIEADDSKRIKERASVPTATSCKIYFK